jgi:hypothetical protein
MCYTCESYIYDYMKQPMRPDNIIYRDIHHKRLQAIIPDCISTFHRFFSRLSEFQFSVAAFIIDTDAAASLDKDETVLKRLAYRSMANWFRMIDNDYELIICLIHENCITKNPEELVGFWLSELFIIKEIHMEHKGLPKEKAVEVEDELYR